LNSEPEWDPIAFREIAAEATKYRSLSPKHNGASGTSDMAGYAARVAVERAGASEIQLALQLVTFTGRVLPSGAFCKRQIRESYIKHQTSFAVFFPWRAVASREECFGQVRSGQDVVNAIRHGDELISATINEM